VPGAAAIGQDADTYDTALHSYTLDIVGGQHPGIAFVPAASDLAPISGGESDELVFRLPRPAVTSSTVLWNNAKVNGGVAGRMDMRSGLCFSVPPDPAQNDGTRLDQGSGVARLALVLLLAAAFAFWPMPSRRRQT
jgi:hypothetical protein